ncbi:MULTISPECIES: hypothetical protein [unclassified Vibrio]|uniref:hypothetical protein n=1 Tax=Vibrio TaxID=662 RepID=UPI0020A24925
MNSRSLKKYLLPMFLLVLPIESFAKDTTMLDELNNRFVTFERRFDDCINSSSQNDVSENIVDKIQALNIDFEISVGYLYKQSLYLCSDNEFSELARIIMIIETSDNDGLQLSKAKASQIRKLLFSKVDLRLESKLQSLPQDKKEALLNLAKKLEPFDLVSMHERLQAM